jgi:serine/threonine protein phosphatase PrpC
MMGIMQPYTVASTTTYNPARSTAVVALLAGSQLAVAHVGDSKAGVSMREGALELTRDHKPNRSDERQRIEV